jgi:putative tricarboxylic transport membrane protein
MKHLEQDLTSARGSLTTTCGRVLRRRLGRWSSLLTTALLVAACGEGGGQPDREGADASGPYPQERLNWTIAFGPGGGNDVMARTFIDILGKYGLYPHPIIATNRAAGSGAQGWGYVFNQTGNPYHISTTSGSFITTPIQAQTSWGPTSFTPIALLATDDVALLVLDGSEAAQLGDFVQLARTRPVTLGGMGSVNVDFMVARQFAGAAGFEFRYVPFNSQGELTAALLSKTLDAAMSSPGAALGLLRSKDVRALAYSGREVPPVLGEVPTFAAQGYPKATMSMPRGLILAPGVSQEVQDWWIAVVKKVVETPEWKAYLERELLTADVRYGADFAAYLVETNRTFRTLLTEAGVAR